jgi:signal transduction histidine kinase/ActR/RegA family two-component response regulator
MARDLSDIAVRDPDGWADHVGRFTVMARTLAERELGSAMCISSAEGRELFVSAAWPLPWSIEARQPIFDAGVAVGELHVQLSSNDLLARVVVVALSALAVGALAYFLVAHVAIGDVQRHIAQLQALRVAAERAGNARSAFLAAMSHEIRTPMNGVIGLLDLLRDTPLDERQKRYLDVMRGSGQTLMRVINDVLDYSRLESGHVEVERRAYNPGALTKQVVQLMAGIAGRKHLFLGAEIDADVPAWVIGDETRIRQVLLNLVGNAIKFSDSGQVWVKLAASGPQTLRWVVSDQGIGMSADQLRRVFRPFVQADAAISRRYGGTGLGLAISLRLVQAMNGGITATSTAGAGSAFSVELPAIEAEAPAEPPDSQAGELGVDGLRVLIVEDNEVNTMIATAMLERLGVDVQSTELGLGAVQAVQEQTFDLVLMDLAMADVDGLEAARRIRALGKSIHQPRIVAVTANVDDGIRERCAKAGMDDFLNKPFHRQELARVVAQAARKSAVV